MAYTLDWREVFVTFFFSWHNSRFVKACNLGYSDPTTQIFKIFSPKNNRWSGDVNQIFFRWLPYPLCMFIYINIYIYIYIFLFSLYLYYIYLFEIYCIKCSPWLPGEGGCSTPPSSSLEKLQISLSQPRPKSYWLIKKSTRGVPPLSKNSRYTKIWKL